MADRRRPPDEQPPTEPKPPPEALLDGLDHDALWQDTAEAQASRAAQKREALESSLARGKTQVRLDARRPGVRLPDHLSDAHALVLNLSWRFADTGMIVNDRGVAATLTFAGQSFRCVLPWSAVWGVVPHGSDTVKVWPADLPTELGGPPRAPDQCEPPPAEPVRPRLAVVDTPAEERVEPAPEPALDDKPRAPWLRLVR